MSETTTTSNVAAVLAGIVMESAFLCGRDLEAVSDEVLNCTQEGKCRSALAMSAELIGFNYLVAGVLSGKGGSFPTPEERDAFAATITSKEIAKAKLDESAGAVCAAVGALTEEDLMTKITAPWGMEVTKAHLCAWSALHMMYHDGQMNLIQILNGDHEVHWMS